MTQSFTSNLPVPLPVNKGGTGVTTFDITGSATQSDLETSTSVTTAVTPGRQQFHPSACKSWITYTTLTTTTIGASYNVTSVTDNGTGNTSITIATDFSTAEYCGVATTSGILSTGGSGALIMANYGAAPTAGVYRVCTFTGTYSDLQDVYKVSVAMFGDQ